MNKVWIVILIIVGVLFFPTVEIILPILILGYTWWILWITLIVEAVAGGVIALIRVIRNLSKKAVEKIKMSPKEAKERARQEKLLDPDNPDNFVINKSVIHRIGEKGTEKTPILILDGEGTELNQRLVAVMNLNNPKEETSWLPDPSEEEIVRTERLIAEHPPEEEIREEITTGMDRFGMPITTTRIRRPSQVEKQNKEEKEAEEKNRM